MNHDVQKRLYKLLVVTRRRARVPSQFNFSQGHTLPKKGMPHMDDSYLQQDARVIHSYGSLSKLDHTLALREGASKITKDARYYAYGAV